MNCGLSRGLIIVDFNYLLRPSKNSKLVLIRQKHPQNWNNGLFQLHIYITMNNIDTTSFYVTLISYDRRILRTIVVRRRYDSNYRFPQGFTVSSAMLKL